KAYTGKLDKEQEMELEEELERNLYHSSKEVVCWIQERWGIVYSLEGCVKLLHRLGFSYKKKTLFSCEADKERQEAFIKELEAIKESLSEQEVFIFYGRLPPTA
ncbi:MAG: winged helix-turn-helix domain-containing protein, partial [Raineya sp.]|nr:winged helix-turn-helix domain-containing protein [Raineya sp.]